MRRDLIKFINFILFLSFFGLGTSILSMFMSLFKVVALMWPVFLFGVIFSALTKGKSKKSDSHPSQKKTKDNEELQKAVSVLKKYFDQQDSLHLESGLIIKKYSNYTGSIDDLYLYLDDDQISTLKDFKKTYPSTYTDLLNQCALMIESGNTQQINDVQTESASEIGNFIEVLHAQNLEIEDEQISNGLYEICAYLKQIDLIGKQFPESREKTRKLTQYYLPILTEILGSYQQLDKSVRNHEEFEKTHQRLLKTILLINEALKTIISSLTQEYFMDLSADMTTLETLLKKDGLVKDGTLSALRKQVSERE